MNASLNRFFLLPLLSLFFSCQHEAPNIILIMADDMGAECLSSYGGTSYHTPNLDKMAAEGLQVSHCISQPLCTPSRVKLMTGRSNSVNYTHFGRLDTAWLNMGTLMKEAGYRTCISGKWQLNGLVYKEVFPDWDNPNRPAQMGFDQYCLWQLTKTRAEGERYADPLIERDGEVVETTLDDYGPDIFSDYVINFIEQNSDGPFFIYYPMVLVHEPFVPTPDSRAWRKAGERYTNDPAHFSDMMNYTDKIVGKIRKKLEEEGIAKNTLLIFTADNGTDRQIVSQTLQRNVRGAKGTTINDGIRVPLIMQWPDKIRKKKVFEGIIEFSDFFATLADLVGREVETEGKSFLPLLKDRAFEERQWAKVHYDPRWGEFVNAHRNSFILDREYKLYQDGSFYNLQEDVLEKRPLDPENLSPGEAALRDTFMTELLGKARSRPNLLFIITDDQGYGDLSLHGNPILRTPHLDAIGLEGTRLDNFHVSPVCAPTRAGVLTGRRPMSGGSYWVTRGGETLDGEEYTMAEVLKDNGYETGYFGKWHNGSHHPSHPMSQGFDTFFGFTGGHWNNYFDPELEYNGQMVQTRGYIADLFADSALAYMERQANTPFLCYLAFNTPHSPFQVPDAYYDMYIDRVEEEDPELKVMNASVYGMVKNIDDNVGRLMDKLVELDLDENTIVVFMTDNGPNTIRYNGHMKGRKAWVNDGGVRVPCFIRWPGHIPQGKIVESTTAHIDLLPTLAGLMDLNFEPPREIHGMDLGPRILGVDREESRYLFTHVNHGQEVKPIPGAVRTADWRLAVTRKDEPELTRRSDVSERFNLADSLPGLRDSLWRLYLEWFSPFQEYQIPPIAVGVVDSVCLQGHEAFIHGGARYFWSDHGWTNDWLHRLSGPGNHAHWNLEVRKAGSYLCEVRYTSVQGPGEIELSFSGGPVLVAGLPAFIPVRDENHSRIDRPAEAIGQSWGRVKAGMAELEAGICSLEISTSDPQIEILEVILLKP